MTDQEILTGLTDAKAMALTAWAEARGDSRDGSSVEERIAVMWVIQNRAHDGRHRWPQTVKDVCLQPWQFSCWDPGTGDNHINLMKLAEQVLTGQTVADAYLSESLYLALGVTGGFLLDKTGGANHYYAPAAMVPPGKIPDFALDAATGRERAPSAVVGSQHFFRL